MDPRREAAIAALAARQHGVVTRGQMRDLGVPDRTIARRVERGLIVPVGSATYRLPAAPATDDQTVMAACLDRRAVGTHRTGAWKHGLMSLGGTIDISVPKGRSTTTIAADRRTLRIYTSTNLSEDDIVVIDGIRVASVARSLFGAAALVPTEVTPAQLLDLVSAAIEGRLASLAWLRWLLDERRCRGRNGVTAFEAALDARVRLGPTESWLERCFLELLDGAGLPRPVLQGSIARAEGRPARVDFAYPDVRVIVEVLGYAFHRTPEQPTADTLRATDLQLEGHLVVQLTSRLLNQDPAAALRRVARALERF